MHHQPSHHRCGEGGQLLQAGAPEEGVNRPLRHLIGCGLPQEGQGKAEKIIRVGREYDMAKNVHKMAAEAKNADAEREKKTARKL